MSFSFITTKLLLSAAKSASEQLSTLYRCILTAILPMCTLSAIANAKNGAHDEVARRWCNAFPVNAGVPQSETTVVHGAATLMWTLLAMKRQYNKHAIEAVMQTCFPSVETPLSFDEWVPVAYKERCLILEIVVLFNQTQLHALIDSLGGRRTCADINDSGFFEFLFYKYTESRCLLLETLIELSSTYAATHDTGAALRSLYTSPKPVKTFTSDSDVAMTPSGSTSSSARTKSSSSSSFKPLSAIPPLVPKTYSPVTTEEMCVIVKQTMTKINRRESMILLTVIGLNRAAMKTVFENLHEHCCAPWLEIFNRSDKVLLPGHGVAVIRRVLETLNLVHIVTDGNMLCLPVWLAEPCLPDLPAKYRAACAILLLLHKKGESLYKLILTRKPTPSCDPATATFEEALREIIDWYNADPKASVDCISGFLQAGFGDHYSALELDWLKTQAQKGALVSLSDSKAPSGVVASSSSSSMPVLYASALGSLPSASTAAAAEPMDVKNKRTRRSSSSSSSAKKTASKACSSSAEPKSMAVDPAVPTTKLPKISDVGREAPSDGRECNHCMDAKNCVAVFPCCHMLTCVTCYNELYSEKFEPPCKTCGEKITSANRIFGV